MAHDDAGHVKMKQEGDKLTFTLRSGREFSVVLPKGGASAAEMERFIEHLKKEVRRGNN